MDKDAEALLGLIWRHTNVEPLHHSKILRELGLSPETTQEMIYDLLQEGHRIGWSTEGFYITASIRDKRATLRHIDECASRLYRMKQCIVKQLNSPKPS
jgi:hypothetical protein